MLLQWKRPVFGVLLGPTMQPNYRKTQALTVKVDSNAVAEEVLRRMSAEDWTRFR
ncbi:hypothetical protein LO763_22455 [Glycomyces sp. A-F 0318]|uniref:hypothetical protein n=1 Tax=Glycomyces amatae TaxID=2881355 RepID=UPI001E31B5B4|nr:hypothetical protein [Glycomyces amatae]MCD0446381.1 hypothetical protein [Glycomyces amatae]